MSICSDCDGSGHVGSGELVSECEGCDGFGVVCNLCGFPTGHPDDDVCRICQQEIVQEIETPDLPASDS